MFKRIYSTKKQRGSALVSTLIVFVSLSGLMYLTTVVAGVESLESREAINELRVAHLSESGVELGIGFLSASADKSGGLDPIGSLAGLFASGAPLTPFVGEPIRDGGGGAQVGAVSVTLQLLDQSATSVSFQVDSTGYMPDHPANLAPGQRLKEWNSVSATVTFSLEPSETFDYSYFINNWGWFYAHSIHANGNARSNGQFDVAGYGATITGQPLYEGMQWVAGSPDLTGYKDDNKDGLRDGLDGGVFSGWDIVGAENVNGQGGNADNQHDFQDQVPMPNLNDLTAYKAKALAEGSSISIGGVTVTDPIYGDDPGESGNLYLVGTAADPIVLNGPVVVEGDVIIKGYVTGQGSIYSGGNLYVPDNVTYLDPPSSVRPVDNTEAETEAWLAANYNKDFLGLFSAENIVVGDFTNPTYHYYTSGWMSNSLNASKEDAGEDGIPNTYKGRDGVAGTDDDDVLEGDGVFTVEYYTAADAALGLIPAGRSVGDVIPGSGEDIDGDGIFDNTNNMGNLALSAPLDTANWGGNMPFAGVANYRDIASLYANHLDGTYYTNHAFTWVVFGSRDANLNGSMVCRNESIVYGTPNAKFNHDARLLGGASSIASNLLPAVLGRPEITRWEELDNDPNRYPAP